MFVCIPVQTTSRCMSTVHTQGAWPPNMAQCTSTECDYRARPSSVFTMHGHSVYSWSTSRGTSMVCIHRAHPRGTSMVGVCGAHPRSTDPYLSFCSCGVGGRGAGRAAHSLSLTSWMHILRRGPGLTVEGHKEYVCQNHRVPIDRHLGISQLSHLEPRNLSEPQLPRVCDEDELLYLHRTHLTGLAP